MRAREGKLNECQDEKSMKKGSNRHGNGKTNEGNKTWKIMNTVGKFIKV